MSLTWGVLRERMVLAYSILRHGQAPLTRKREVPSITAEEVAEIKLFFPMPKFFIFGHARSGTTVLARLIRLHPEVHCNYQAHFFTRPPLLESLVADEKIGEWLSRPSNRWNRGGDLSALVLRAAADCILEREARREGKHIVGDKSPNSLMDGEAVRLMHKVYPDGKLIYIVRDGRDVVISHRLQTFLQFASQLKGEDRRIYQAFLSAPQPFVNGEISLFSEESLAQAAQGWVRNVTETDRLGKELYGEEGYTSLRYEDLLAHPFEVMRRLWQFLGAAAPTAELEEAIRLELEQNPDAEWQKQQAGELMRALPKGRQGAWRQMFTRRDCALFGRIAGETLRAWGYEETPCAS